MNFFAGRKAGKHLRHRDLDSAARTAFRIALETGPAEIMIFDDAGRVVAAYEITDRTDYYQRAYQKAYSGTRSGHGKAR